MRRPALPIGFFLTSFDAGGTERQMLELIGRLDPSRFEIHVACFHRSGVWLPRAERAARSVEEFRIAGFARASTAAALSRFVRWCRSRRLALLHTCDFYANVFGLAGGTLARVPVRIANRRELNPDKSAGQIALQRLAYLGAHCIVANSDAAAERLLAERVPHARIRVIPNGIDATAYRPAHRRAFHRITMVAKLRREKAHEVLIEAAARLAPRFRGLQFQLAGNGPREAELRALVRTRGLDREFTFMGHREDIPALLESSDIFVLPSRSEAFPNGVLEAMAAGLPVVTTCVGGLRELVDHGRTGLLVQPDDPRALADAIASLVENPDRAMEIGRAARRHVEARYAFDHMVGRFEHLYLTELAARGVAVPVAEREGDGVPMAPSQFGESCATALKAAFVAPEAGTTKPDNPSRLSA